MTYKIIESGSRGNAVLYFNQILIDIGVSFKTIEPYLNNIKLILLTHKHKDHINKTTLRKAIYKYPNIRVACGEYLLPELQMINQDNIDVLEPNKLYDYKRFQVSPFNLYHDVPNVGYRIYKNGYKIFHATDTYTLEGINAPGYDLYAIEHNYCEEIARQAKVEAAYTGEFCRVILSEQSHLSEQEAHAFIQANAGANSQVLKLHQSSEFGYG